MKHIILFFLPLLLAGCEKEPNEKDLDMLSRNLMPLATGNTWTYLKSRNVSIVNYGLHPDSSYHNTHIEMWEALAPATINNTRYWQIRVTDPATGNELSRFWISNASGYLRTCSNTGITWVNGNGKTSYSTAQEVLFDFHLPGHEFKTHPTISRSYAYESVHSQYGFNNQARTDIFELHTGYTTSLRHTYNYAQNSFGPVQSIDTHTKMNLIASHLN